MLIIFFHEKNFIEVLLDINHQLIIENITNYEYNMYGEIIPPVESQYLIKINVQNINLKKFFLYKKHEKFNMYLLNNKPCFLPMTNIETSMRKLLLEDFFNNFNKKFNKEYFITNNLIEVLEVFLEDISLEINKDVFYNLILKFYVL